MFPKSLCKEGSAKSAPENRREQDMGEITLKLMAYIFFTVNAACLPGKDSRGHAIQVFGLFRDFGETGRWET